MPGYPLDSSLAGLLSPIHGFQAASDPMVRAGSNGLLYYSGLAFNRGAGGQSEVFIARFIDRNNKENGNPINEVGSMTNVVPLDPIRYTGIFPIAFGTDDIFLDKPSLEVDIPRSSATCTIFIPENGTIVTETIPAGRVYVAYTALYTPDRDDYTPDRDDHTRDRDDDDERLPKAPSAIFFKSSSNCGYTWSRPINLSRKNQTNQGSAIAIDPNNGTVYVAWRRFYNNTTGQVQPDAILIRKSTDGGNTFSRAVAVVTFPASCAPAPTGDPTQPGCPFDQFSAPGNGTFRTSDYPTLAVDGSGRVYLAWSQRQQTQDARIMMKVSDGINWSSPAALVDNSPLNDDYGTPLQVISGRGHQIMPSLSLNAGKLTLGYYDLREDHTVGVFDPKMPDPTCDPALQFPCMLGAQYNEVRQTEAELVGNLTNPAVFNPYITDLLISQGGTLSTRRHTMEVTAAQATPNASATDLSVPAFTVTRVSKYAFGTFPQVGINDIEQLQFNPGGLPLFVKGTTAFAGDYIHVAGAPTMVFDRTTSRWRVNTGGTNAVFHVVWADNRDVRPPLDGVSWQNYVPPYSASNPQGTTNQSKFDPTQNVPPCVVGVNDSTVGMRNQNIYTSQLTQGLAVSSLQTSKPLLDNGQLGIQRAFAVTAKNATNAARSFQWTAHVVPASSTVVASFDQFDPTVTTRRAVNIPAFSSVSLPVFVQATGTTGTDVSVEVDVTENVANNPLQGSVVLNSDPSNPTLLNPDNAVFGNGTITNAEFYNPLLGPPTSGSTSNNTTLLNPGQGNPGQGNPGQGNPGQGNNGYTNPNFIAALLNPGQGNPGQGNTVLLNPGQGNPGQGNNGIANPGQGNPGQGNTAVADVNFSITDQGNTGATYSVKLFPTAPLPPGITIQVMLSKIYTTTRGGTAAEGTACQLVTELNTVPIVSVIEPTSSSVNDLMNPGQGNPGQGNPGQGNPGQGNPTLALAPGESGQLTIRVAGPLGSTTPPSQDQVDQTLASLVPIVFSQAVNTVDAQAGSRTPPFSTPGGNPIFIANTLPGGANPLPDGVTTAVGLAPVANAASYVANLTRIGGVGPFLWSASNSWLNSQGAPISPPFDCSAGLPPGLALTDTVNGLISGNPTFAGRYCFAVQVKDTANHMTTANLEIRIASPLFITTASPLPTATQGTSYGPVTLITNNGGIAPYTWTYFDQKGNQITTIDGLALSSTGVISGIPTATGNLNFAARVMDSALPNQSPSIALTLNVIGPAQFLLFSRQPTNGIGGVPMNVSVTALDSSEAALPGINITLAVQNNPSGGTLSPAPGTNLTVTTNAAGTAAFAVSIDRGSSAAGCPNSGYTLEASAPGGAFVISNCFGLSGFAPTGGMAAGRIYPTATLLNNGMVLVTGGSIGGAISDATTLASAELSIATDIPPRS